MTQNKFMSVQKKTFKSVLVILMLCFALGFVVYAMRYTQSDQFVRGLELFFGPPQPVSSSKAWHWCPEKTERVEFYIKRATEDLVVPEQICDVMIEPVSEEKASRPLRKYLSVGSGVGENSGSKTLEADDDLEVFRIDGLIFQSQGLSKTLKGH